MGHFKMASDGIVMVACSGYAMFSFLCETRRHLLCMKCKLMAVLMEKIVGLDEQVEMLLRIRETEVFLDCQVQETSVL